MVPAGTNARLRQKGPETKQTFPKRTEDFCVVAGSGRGTGFDCTKLIEMEIANVVTSAYVRSVSAKPCLEPRCVLNELFSWVVG